MGPDELAELRRRVEALEERRVVEVERIDVVEADGRLRMVIANSALAPDPVVDGQTMNRDGGNPAGLIFYNEEGDECGGLVFGGQRQGDHYSAGAALLFDQFKQDQVLGLTHNDSDGRRRAGVSIWDRPDEPYPTTGGATRLFAGKTVEGSAVVHLHDAMGRVRIRVEVPAQGAPCIEILDDGGQVTAHFP